MLDGRLSILVDHSYPVATAAVVTTSDIDTPSSRIVTSFWVASTSLVHCFFVIVAIIVDAIVNILMPSSEHLLLLPAWPLATFCGSRARRHPSWMQFRLSPLQSLLFMGLDSDAFALNTMFDCRVGKSALQRAVHPFFASEIFVSRPRCPPSSLRGLLSCRVDCARGSTRCSRAIN